MKVAKVLCAVAVLSLVTSGLFAAGQQGVGGGAPAASGGKTVIEFVNLKREVVDIMNYLIGEFEKENPTIDIEQTIVPDPERVLVTRMASGDVPDLFMQWPTVNFQQRVDAGYIANLDGIAALNNVNPDSLKQTRYKGHDYIIPISYNTMGVWINKDIFAKYNVQYPKDWAGFVAACETFKKNGVTPALICGKELEPARQDACVYLTSVPSWPQVHADLLAKKIDLSKPYGNELRDMAKRIVQYASFAQEDILGAGRDQLRADFASGKSAMYIEGSWCIPTFLAANPNFNFALMPFPAVKASDSKVCAFAGDFALCMSATAKYPEQSKKFLEFMTRTSSGQYYAEKDGSISTIKGVSYAAPQLADQMAFINGGGGMATPDVVWTTAQQDAVGAAIQTLYMNKDTEAFVQTFAKIFNEAK
jgi:raffinose/stachyose/melibiose transport system substrate-binding protein